MLRTASTLVVCLVAITLAVAGPPPEEAVGVADPGTNVLVTITINGSEGASSSPRSYRMVAEDGGPGARLFIGSRVPIPTTTFQSAGQGSEVVPYTSYVYQNVGFDADVSVELLPDGRVQLDARIEDSVLDEEATGKHGRPYIDARSQRVSAVVENGVPLEVTRFDRASRSAAMQIQADIMR